MKPKKFMSQSPALLEILTSQGLGSKRECLSALRFHEVRIGYHFNGEINWTEVKDPEMKPDLGGLQLHCGMWQLPYHKTLYLALNKPADVECSRSPTSHASVLDFFSEPFRRRGLQPVGRLDADATGLLLLSDDGDFNHIITSPKRKLPKTYRIGVRHHFSPEQQQSLEKGVILKDDSTPTAPAKIRRLSDREIDITITEGRYHQVKRMLGAVGNRVESIHRIAIGELQLGDLSSGEWRYLTSGEVEGLRKVKA